MSQEDLVKSYTAWSDISKSFEERLRAYLNICKHPEYSCYDAAAMRNVDFVSASVGRTEFAFTVTDDMCNVNGTLHGGCAATMLDCLTSTPGMTIAKPGFLEEGTMSRTLSCTYLRALRPGDKVKVVCEVMHAGKTLAHFRGDMIDEQGRVAVSCVHDKVTRHKL